MHVSHVTSIKIEQVHFWVQVRSVEGQRWSDFSAFFLLPVSPFSVLQRVLQEHHTAIPQSDSFSSFFLSSIFWAICGEVEGLDFMS